MPSQAWVDGRRLAMYDSVADMLSDLEERFTTYVPTGPAEADLKKALAYEPMLWGGMFPTLSVTADTTAFGGGGSDKQKMPGSVQVYVRVWYPALTAATSVDAPGALESAEDGRHKAKLTTRRIHDAWLKGFREDRQLRTRVSSMNVSATDAGDVDRFGQSRIDESGRSILWAHTTTVEVQP